MVPSLRWIDGVAVRRYHSVCPAAKRISSQEDSNFWEIVCGPTFAVCYGDDSSGWFFGFARRCVCYLEGFSGGSLDLFKPMRDTCE